MAGQPLELLTGGAGAISAPRGGNAAGVKQSANGAIVGAGTKAHHGVIGLVVLAVLLLLVLDRLGFRFAVTAGRR